MKTRIPKFTAFLSISCAALCLTACQQKTATGTSTVAPTITIGNVVSDLTLASSVAAQYEAAAKAGKVTPGQYAGIAQSAATQYAATQPSSTALDIAQWVTVAADLVAMYDAAHTITRTVH